MNTNVFSHPQEALPLEVWSNVRQASPVLINLAYQAAFVLISLVLILFVAARVVGRTRGTKRRKAKPGMKAAGPIAVFPDDPTGLLAILGENSEMSSSREQREGTT